MKQMPVHANLSFHKKKIRECNYFFKTWY